MCPPNSLESQSRTCYNSSVGEALLALDVGGIPVSLELRSGAFSPDILDRYRPFQTARKPKYRLSLQKFPKAVARRAWLPSVVSAEHSLRCRSSEFEWDLALQSGKGRGKFRDTNQAFDSVLRALYCSVAPLNLGVVLHSAALVRNGGAYLFAGESGAGKTTISRTLCPEHSQGGLGVRTLTDELTLVRRFDRKLHACATPFWGEFRRPGANGHAPLRKVFLLVKSPGGPRRVAVSRIEAQRRLLKCLVSFHDDRDALQQSWDLLWKMICNVAVEEFHWHKDDDLSDVVEAIK